MIDIKSKMKEETLVQTSTDGNYFGACYDVEVNMEGNPQIIITELVAIFDTIEEKVPTIWGKALDLWLSKKGV